VSVRLLALLIGISMAASPAFAEGDRMPPVTDATAKQECGTCHMAFQPGFLPARSWNRIMDGLADHFGEDADFLRKHRFADTVWKDPKVLTKSNCLACHSGAEQGRFE
jgi:nitrate/TMAO reductase-like tetraheme cytochrome c subunit